MEQDFGNEKSKTIPGDAAGAGYNSFTDYQQQAPPPYPTADPNAAYPPNTAFQYPGQPQQYQKGGPPPPGAYGAPPVTVVAVGPVPLRPDQQAPDYLWASILTCLCCCWPLGLVAIIYSVMVRNSNDMGDEVSARARSKTALGLNIAAVVGGIICWIILVVVYAV